MQTILIVEDDLDINQMIRDILKSDYTCTSAFSGSEAILQLENHNFSGFDLILLDLMLPGIDGQTVLKQIRQKSTIPIIVLTSLSDKKTTVEILLSGANDYISKPFFPDELKARIAVQLRNESPSKSHILSHKNLIINTESLTAQINEKILELSQKEFQILILFLQNPNKVFTKEMIYESVWQESFYGDINTIYVHLSNLRSKLKQADPNTKYIETVWGIGSRLSKTEN